MTTAIITRDEISSYPKVIEIKENIEQALRESREIEVVMTPLDIQTATHYSKNLSKLFKSAEAVRKEINAPYDEAIDTNNTFFKQLLLDVRPEIIRLDNETKKCMEKQQEVARQKALEEKKAAEEKAIQEGIEKEKKLKDEAIARGEDPSNIKVEVPIVPETVVEDRKLSTQNTSGVSMARKKTFEIVGEVPREFMIVDEKKVKAYRDQFGFDDQSPVPWLKFGIDYSVRH